LTPRTGGISRRVAESSLRGVPFHEAAGRLVPPAGVESSAHDHGVIATQATDLAGGQQINAEAFVTQPICHRLSQALGAAPRRAERNQHSHRAPPFCTFMLGRVLAPAQGRRSPTG
jgi:hypothetical protein